MRVILALLFLLAPLGASDLIPLPRKVTPGSGTLLIDVQTAVIAPADLADQAGIIAAALQKTTGFLHRVRTPQQVGMMRLNRPIKLALKNISDKPGFYRLRITPEEITLTAPDLSGLTHGAQTIANLLPLAKKPQQRGFLQAQTIDDWPETSRRIFHLDVGAHLFPTADLKTLVDWLSFHKLNELHLQLNNDHGWRLESTSHPRLHKIGSARSSTPPYGDRTGSDSTAYGGYYTRENIRTLLAHAKKRDITIIPSFSFTTGASAIIASYPELGHQPATVAKTWEPREIGLVDSRATLAFLDALFAETAALFPGSEVRIEGPAASLHAKIETLLEKHRRRALFPSNFATTDLSLYQRPADEELLATPSREARGGFNPVSRVYGIDPTPAGAQATLHTEFIHDFEKLHYSVFPRLTAFAEATWLAKDQRNYEDFRTRLERFDSRFRLAGIGAAMAYDPPAAKALHNSIVTTNLKARKGNAPELIFDGNQKSFFWSAEGLEKDDHLTVEFPWPATGEITVTTGKPGGSEAILEEGFLELSSDGNRWHTSEPLIAGTATATVREPTRFVRLRASAPQTTSLVLPEIILPDPLLAPLHEESRVIELPVSKKEISLTFKADFRAHPERRQRVQEARHFYFKQWLPLALKLGVAHHPQTPVLFELKSADLPPAGIDLWMKKQMILHLREYQAGTPPWFASGFTRYLLEDFPKDPDLSKPLAGDGPTAAFFRWIAKTHGENILSSVSLDCRYGRYRPEIWKFLTKKSLDELVRDYQGSR